MSGYNFQQGSYSAPLDFRIGQVPPPKLNDPDSKVQQTGIIAALNDIYFFASQVIRAFVDYCGIGPQLASNWSAFAGNPVTLLSGNLNRLYVTAEEDVLFGAAISLHSLTGSLTIRNADATDNSRPCDGFCSTPNGILSGAVGEVQLHSGVAFVGGLTIGARYYLSAVAGNYSATPAVGAGNIEQYLGVAITPTQLAFNSQYWIQH